MGDPFNLGVGFIVNLDKLTLLLEYISHGAHRWEMTGDDTWERGDTQSVLVRYSNPGEFDLPNQISFRFPCISDGNPLFSATLASFHASLAEPVCRGLYLDGEDVKYDCIEDWERFWPPIQTALFARLPR